MNKPLNIKILEHIDKNENIPQHKLLKKFKKYRSFEAKFGELTRPINHSTQLPVIKDDNNEYDKYGELVKRMEPTFKISDVGIEMIDDYKAQVKLDRKINFLHFVVYPALVSIAITIILNVNIESACGFIQNLINNLLSPK